MALSAGNTVLHTDMAALFTRLEAIRTAHNKRADMSDVTGTISSPTSVGKTVAASDVTAAKTAITKLENGIPNMSGFASQITIPTVGALLQASTLTKLNTVITNMEKVCANNTNNSNNSVNGFDSFNSFDFFTCGHSFGNNSSNCTWF